MVCDICGQNQAAFMTTEIDSGDTKARCPLCLIMFATEVAEILGLVAPGTVEGTAGGDDDQGAGSPPAKAGNGQGRRRAGGRGSESPDHAGPEAQEAEPAAAVEG